MTKAEKRFGLTIEEIRELKCWYVKQQDFETAVMWREMERMIIPPSKSEVKVEKVGDHVTLEITLLLPDGWSYNKPLQP